MALNQLFKNFLATFHTNARLKKKSNIFKNLGFFKPFNGIQ